MAKTNECRCDKKVCGCAKAEPCTCGPSCACQTTCNCGNGCSCGAAK
jgi:hypothetical protein